MEEVIFILKIDDKGRRGRAPFETPAGSATGKM
jgi:hypothetical protein